MADNIVKVALTGVGVLPVEGITDAPADGNQYTRKDNAWDVNDGITDAPADGQQYARKDNAWDVVSTGATPARTIHVAQSGGDFTTLAAAITAAIALTPTVSNPVVIIIHPGTYITAPLTIPAYVSVIGIDGHDASIIEASTTTAALLTLAANGIVRDCTIKGASGVGGIGIELTTGAASEVSSLVFRDCETGIKADGAGTSIRGIDTEFYRSTGEVLGTGLSVTGLADAYMVSMTVKGDDASTRVGTAVHVTNASIMVSGTDFDFCTKGYDIDTDADGFLSGGWIDHCDEALIVGVRASLSCMSIQVQNSVTFDLNMTDITAKFRFTGGFLLHEKLFVTDGADLGCLYLSETEGDESFQVQADMSVGSETIGRESAFGGGAPHVRGLVAITNTNLEVGTTNDVTSIVSVDDGNSTGLLAGPEAGQCMFIGGDQKFVGFKTETTLAAVAGTGGAVQENWNGSAWVFNFALNSDAFPPYQQYAVFGTLRVNTEQVRFDIAPSWELKTLFGHTKYWIRVRIVAEIDVVPEVNFFKLHASHSKFNPDGFLEFFGAEPTRDFPNFGLENTVPLSGSSPANASIELADTITAVLTNNRFRSNNRDGRVATLPIPDGLDTSRVLIFEISWRPSSGATGVVVMQCDYVALAEGAAVDGTAVTANAAVSVALSGQQNTRIVTILELSIPFSLPGEELTLSVFRDGGVGDDTFSGSAELMGLRLTGNFWR